jgi:DNA-binding response OmpR family regulator
LAARGRTHAAAPHLDPIGQLWHRSRCTTLSPTEERLAAVFVARFGDVIDDDELLQAGWPDGDGSGGALRIHLTRLRRRLRPLRLEIRSKRTVGHVMRDAGGDAPAELVAATSSAT